MSQSPNKITFFMGLPRHGLFWLVLPLLISIVLHLLSFVGLTRVFTDSLVQRPNLQSKGAKVTVNMVKKKKKLKSIAERSQKLLEVPLKPTETPKVSDRLGAQDHATVKPTKSVEVNPSLKSLDPGQKSIHKHNVSGHQVSVDTKASNKKVEDDHRDVPLTQGLSPAKKNLSDDKGVVPTIPRPRENRPRNLYEALIPRSVELAQQVQAGYQDYIDEEIEVGERVDFNTTNFRYLGYFTSVRKAFELVWTYPSEAARRGLQGEVKVEFTISKDGSLSGIRVLDSSGHKILDNAVIEAMKIAAPFAPLPQGMMKDRLTITGSFRYVLTNYAGSM